MTYTLHAESATHAARSEAHCTAHAGAATVTFVHAVEPIGEHGASPQVSDAVGSDVGDATGCNVGASVVTLVGGTVGVVGDRV
jgi:hypothetical protein